LAFSFFAGFAASLAGFSSWPFFLALSSVVCGTAFARACVWGACSWRETSAYFFAT
jgi:hypothetical protein